MIQVVGQWLKGLWMLECRARQLELKGVADPLLDL